jgi:CheY-like chemotaxis protein
MAEAEQDSPVVGATEERQKRLVVVADSDSTSLYYTSMLLQRMDYNIQTLRLAGEVLDLLDVARPALILTELIFPDMDGLEFIRKIKRNPRTYALPVIVLTASKDPGARDVCMREACKDYLQKPVEPEDLYAAVQKVTEITPRQFIRLVTALNVIVGSGREAELSASQDLITALSEQGMFITSPKPQTIGARLPITILLENARLPVEGEVLYSFGHGQGPLKLSGMGIKFTRIAPEDRGRIKAYIRRQVKRDVLAGARVG